MFPSMRLAEDAARRLLDSFDRELSGVPIDAVDTFIDLVLVGVAERVESLECDEPAVVPAGVG